MEQIVLKAEPRDVVGKQVKTLRRQGRLPAVIYGHRVDSIAISLDFKDASRIMPTITSSHLIAVELNGVPHMALVREKQREPVTGALLHVDFQEVSMTEKLRATVVIELVGDAPAIKNYNGVVVSGMEAVEVECLPADLPERITVDLAALTEIGSAVYVRDLTVSPKVEVLTDANEMVALVTAPAAEVTEEVTPAEEEPEVIEKGKKEDEF